jgi:hypothetical protein
MSDSEKTNRDPNATMNLDAIEVIDVRVGDSDSLSEMTVVRGRPDEAQSPPAPGSTSPRPRVEPAAARRPNVPNVPRFEPESDDQDANTTILLSSLDSSQLAALKRRLRGALDDDDVDANRTLEFHAIRAVQLDELERLLNSASNPHGADPNITMQLDIVDDGKLEELEASLAAEKRTRGVRKMSHALHDADASPSHALSGPLEETGDDEILAALANDVAAAWAVVLAFVVRIVARTRAWLSGRPGDPARSSQTIESGRPAQPGQGAPARRPGPDDTVPPMRPPVRETDPRVERHKRKSKTNAR